MTEDGRKKMRIIRLFILIFLLVGCITTTSGTHRRKSIRWHRFKRQHLSYDPQSHNNHLIRHPHYNNNSHEHDALIIPHNVALGQDNVQYKAQESGRWSEWSTSSGCSRTCGGGVASQTRHCLDIRSDGTPVCHGPNKKFFSCNIQDCPEGSMDFRAEQCARYNNVPFDGVYYDWIPYTQAPVNKCELNCMPRGESLYYRHARRVIDGTRCDPERLDVCVEGMCLPVGCDLMLGSNAKEDNCRKCGGDGSTCRIVDGVYETDNLHTGYNDILLIPAGATNIAVEERRGTNNYLAIRNLTGHYYLNGNWRIDFPRSLTFAGSTFHYERNADGLEKLSVLGPTTEALFIVLLYHETNPGIAYEYYVPKELSRTETDTYSWVYGAYTECSQSCGGGYQTRNVSCAKTANFDIVPDYLCDPLLQSSDNRSCNTQPCPPSWYVGDWESCSASCGSGLQYRAVYCQQIAVGSTPITVNNSECENTIGPRPTHLRPCSTDMPCPQWNSGPWSSCDKLCGIGERTRFITCQRTVNDTIEVFPDAACKDSPKPENKEKCDKGPCEGVDWIVSPWSGCEACNFHAESRQALCASQSGSIFPNELCDAGRMPTTLRKCLDSPPCDYMWYATQWSECSSKCGDGIETRDVFCGTVENDAIKRVSDDKCDPKKRYDDWKNCTGNLCKGTWFTGPWSQCTAPCGDGYKTRKVLCLKDEKEVGDTSHCHASKKPLYKERCNTHPCDDDEILTVGGCKDSKHGCCPDGVTPAGPNYEGCPTVIPDDGCENSEFGCCRDGITPALGPFRKGCPKLYKCEDTKYKCCPDGVNAAKGPDNLGCPSPDSCASTLYGCCPDGITVAKGEKFVGCDFVPAHECLTSEYGCCPDGTKSAEGSGYEGCSLEDEITATITDAPVIDDIGSGLDCSDSLHGCCADGITQALGPDQEGCPENITSPATPTPTGVTILDCEAGPFGCCPDNITFALGSNGEGCETPTSEAPTSETLQAIDETDPTPIALDCDSSVFGCCSDGLTSAQGPNDEGCPEATPIPSLNLPEPICSNSAFGCCPDGVSEATGPNYEGCEIDGPTPTPPCHSSVFGCCPDNITTASGPNYEGCEIFEPSPTPTCHSSEYGCCVDNVTSASGPNYEGCEPVSSPTCHSSEYGCCVDNVTTASGPNYEGCEPVSSPTCHSSAFGCCPDNVTESRGPNFEGCPPCSDLPFGCCYDQRTPARGPHYEGCGCETYPYGCCPDGVTFARGPNNEGCGCIAAAYGCCPDGVTSATGPNYEGCDCSRTVHGCCPDQHTPAQGPNNEGCHCSTYQHGCCPDGVTPALGPHYIGCSCESWYYGCCPDGLTAARGPNQEGCDCSSTLYGCCPDGVTPAAGPNFEACPDHKQRKPGEVCGHSKETGQCRNFTVKWFFDMDYGGCSRFWYGGCEGNDNRFDTQEECEQICVAPEGMDACNLPKVIGPCDGQEVSWHYDSKAGECQQFFYSGCLGNNNRFTSQEQCMETCQKPLHRDPCQQPVVKGPCEEQYKRWHYDSQTGYCKEFTYGGCKGNENNFESEKDCNQQCVRQSETEVCFLPRERGACGGQFVRWYFDFVESKCKEFVFGGCQGNDNRFVSKELCENLCIKGIPNGGPKKDDICKLSRTEGPCRDYQIKWYFDQDAQQCGQFYYGGCQGNANRFENQEECLKACTKKPEPTIDICTLPSDPGNCNTPEEKWFFDVRVGACTRFAYSGCGGNDNNFGSQSECQYRCNGRTQDEPSSVTRPTIEMVHHPFLPEYCHLDHDPGTCDEMVQRLYYDKSDGVCKQFQYGGCGGNANNFKSVSECEERCTHSQDVCLLPKVVGPCSGTFRQWFYDIGTNTCEEFQYGGCQGNANRFDSPEECESRCAAQPSPAPTLPPDLPDFCQLPGNAEPCYPSVPSWYYDASQGKCTSSIYGRCQGNANQFESEEDCERGCGQYRGRDVCIEPLDRGTCNDNIEKWYYATSNHTCIRFSYTGCEGNGNRFSSSYECEKVCLTNSKYGAPQALNITTDRCHLPADPGPCSNLQHVWFYDFQTSTCVLFTYGGCMGNDNRFASYEECIGACGSRKKTCPDPKECYELNCPYGIEQYEDQEGCPHCRCSDPCRGFSCPEGTQCVVQQEQDQDGNIKTRPECTDPAQPVVSTVAVVEEEPSTTPTPGPTVELPHIVSTEPEIVTSSGETAVLPCATEGSPQPSIEWTKENGESIKLGDDNSRYKLLLDGSLQIEDVNQNDTGNYVCTASNPAGTAQKSTRLIIQENVSADIKLNQTTFSPDSEIQIDCQTNGSQRTLWYKDGALLHTNEGVLVFANGTLLIKRALPIDSGTYMCEAANYYNTATASVTIEVLGISIPDDCTDNLYFANCKLIVKAKYCHNKYYANFCCRSCAMAGQLGPQTVADLNNNLV